jgi:hypothetical protein
MTTLTIDSLLLPLFLANILMILLDASIGYHLTPQIFPAAPEADDDPFSEEEPPAPRTIRWMLTGVVALYMFFNCLAFFRKDAPLIMVVSALILLDILGQLYVRRKTRQGKDKP